MSGIKSFGVKLKVGSATVGKLTDVNISGGSVTEVDITAHDSAGGYKEFVGGLKDGGSVAASGNYEPADAGQTYLRTHFGDTAAFEIEFSDGSKAAGNCVVGAYEVTNPLDDKIGFACSLRCSGAVTFTAASGG